MSETLFEEYKDYYKVRRERYADNPNYKHSYEAEKNLCDAFLSCREMSEFKTKIGNLNELCANALTKDKYIMENNFFTELQEVVRKKTSERILQKVDNYEKVFDLISMVQQEENKGMIEISMDEANRLFHYSWHSMDSIEVYENAEVPSEYKKDMQEVANWSKDFIKQSLKDMIENNSHWESGWKHNPDVCTEYRHRRLLPYKDEHITEMLRKYKTLLNL